MLKKAVLGTVVSICICFIFSTISVAGTYSGYANVTIVKIKQENSPKKGITIDFKFTGKGGVVKAGEHRALNVSETEFGTSGVNRVQSMALAGLMAKKQFWISYEASSPKSTNGKLKEIHIRP